MREAPSNVVLVDEQYEKLCNVPKPYASVKLFSEIVAQSQIRPLSTHVLSRALPFDQTVHLLETGLSQPSQNGHVLTFWHTTHNGRPSALSHSPGPNGRLTSPSLDDSPPDEPLPRSLQRSITSSILSLHPGLRDCNRTRNKLTQSLSWRSHSHGWAQSSRITMRVLGIVSGVRSDCNRGVNAGDESASR